MDRQRPVRSLVVTQALLLISSVALVVTIAVAQQTVTETVFAACNLEAEVAAAVRPSALPHTDEAPRTMVPDRLLEGMVASGLQDAAYREAYRECMRGRGF